MASQVNFAKQSNIGNLSTWHGECSPAPDLENWQGASQHIGTEPTDRFSHRELGLHCTEAALRLAFC